MTTFRDAILPAVDAYRGIPGLFGIRLFVPTILVRVWSGDRVGAGTATDTSFSLKTALGLFSIKARVLSDREIVASNGLYHDQDVELGPITPPFPGSSVLDNSAISTFDPAPGTSPTEVFFKITGPGYPGYVDANTPGPGAWFKKIAQRTDRPFRYMLVVRKTAEIVVPVAPTTTQEGLGISGLPMGLGV